MAANISAANIGGLADSRLGVEPNVIVTKDEHPEMMLHEIPSPVLNGHGSIYLDTSINFESYHYWAPRSREIEKSMPTDNVGFAQLAKIMNGKKPKAPLPSDSTGNNTTVTPNEKKTAPELSNQTAKCDTSASQSGNKHRQRRGSPLGARSST